MGSHTEIRTEVPAQNKVTIPDSLCETSIFFCNSDLTYLKVNGVIPFDDWPPPGTVFSRKWLYALPLSLQSVATLSLSAGREAEFNNRLYFEMKCGQKMNGFFAVEDV